MGFLGAIAKNLDTIIGPGVMLLYPLFASIRAIETPSALDDQQWLTYWILYSFITVFELSCWKVLVWIPIWSYMKLLFCMWLVFPIFNGAAYIYENIVRKYVKLGGYLNRSSSNQPEAKRKVLQMISLDTRTSVERFIDQHGMNAFESAVKAAETEIRKY